MKKFNFLLILVLMAGFLNAQDLSGISICINPGHGGHDSDDRFIEETGYWESEGNLTKGLYLRDILENCGASIVMTRVTNYTSDDLPLSQICQIANDNDVDYFHSIHSNAFNGSGNYPLLLFRGYDDNPVFPDAKVMAQYIWDEFITNENLVWNYGFPNVRGDWDFYPQWGTSGLGVLRNLDMPGVLSEGSFHDYYPESWRLQNLDYRKYESWNLADAFITFYGQPAFSTGLVTGVVRDPYVNTDYYFVPGSNDEKIPINNFTATLLPENSVYQGDAMNNGVFFFDSISAGNHSIIFEAEGYFNDTVEINVTAGETTTIDRYLPFDTTVAPAVNHFMPSLPDSIGATESITFNFSSPMLSLSVEEAFSIEPSLNGEFIWEDDDKKLIFTHTEPFEKATEYTVTLSTEAKSIWHVPIPEEYSFSFVTKNRNRLSLVDMFPKNNLENVSTKLQFRLIFDAPLAQSSLIGNVILYNEADEILSTSGAIIFDDEGKGYYFFQAQQELQQDRNYKLVLMPEIYDTEGNPFYETLEINFSTSSESLISGTVIDNLESMGAWQDPDNSIYTQGTDPNETTFTLSPYFKISGIFSGKIKYSFTGNEGGICAASNGDNPNIGSGDNTKFGMWIFGDLSYNILEYWFYHNETENTTVFIDTIDWAGWDLKYISVDEIAGTGDRLFHSVVIKQNPEGLRKGEIYIDDLQTDIVVPTEDIIENEFYLQQNYPNPFKNNTTFAYNLPTDADVKLEIFNLLGQKIVSYEVPQQKSGLYNISWNGKNTLNNLVENGAYIYKLSIFPLSENNKTYRKSGVCLKY